MLLTLLGWPTMAEVEHDSAPMYRLPPIVWVGVAARLLATAIAHANLRKTHEQEELSGEHGWQYSKDSSPILESDWQQRSKNPGLAVLWSGGERHNFTYGVHRGAQFVLFEAPGLHKTGDYSIGYENLIAFHTQPQASAVAHLTVGQESAAWQKFPTDNWIFLRSKNPRGMLRGAETVRFVEEAYQQLQIL
jgi:hypothetical protein